MSAKLFSLTEWRRHRNLEAAEFIQLERTGWPLLDACLSWNRMFSDVVVQTLELASLNTHGGTEDEPL